MTDKEFRRLSKADLLDIIFELQKNEKALLARNAELEKQLESKELKISSAGSIAEAAVAVNGVFETAQTAAEQYLHQIRNAAVEAEIESERIIKEAEAKASAMLDATRADCNKMLRENDEMIAERREELAELIKSAIRTVNKNK